jgi:hypothetical protein
VLPLCPKPLLNFQSSGAERCDCLLRHKNIGHACDNGDFRRLDEMPIY